MTTDDLGPTESVMFAANIYARELARGTPLGQIPGMYPDRFEHLTASQRSEARRYGVEAWTYTQAVQNLPPGAPISDLPDIVPQSRTGGPWDVTASFAPDPQAGETKEQYRTVLIAAGPSQTRGSILQTAREEVYGLSDPPTGDLDDINIVYVPFDTHRS